MRLALSVLALAVCVTYVTCRPASPFLGDIADAVNVEDVLNNVMQKRAVDESDVDVIDVVRRDEVANATAPVNATAPAAASDAKNETAPATGDSKAADAKPAEAKPADAKAAPAEG